MLHSLTWWRAFIAGAWDYHRHRTNRGRFGGPFNDQAARKALFMSLLQSLRPRALVETGVYRGTTTEFFASTGLPVIAVEIDPKLYGYSCSRLLGRRNVRIVNDDSRAMLRSLLDGPLWAHPGGCTFFYLDAHWGEDLPLAEEIDIVFSRCPDAVVMIDDFAVPGDAGYGYDEYGGDKALTARYIEAAVRAHELATFYPSTPSADETGRLRGCVVLARADRHGARLSTLPLLRAACDTVNGPGLPAPLPTARLPPAVPASAAAQLLLACTSPAPRQSALPTGNVDWAEFVNLCLRHAAAPLVHRALDAEPDADVPPGVRTALRRQAQVNRLRTRLLQDELARIAVAARHAGVALVAYKGPLLAQQLYGDSSLRVSSDLDLLVDLPLVDRTAAVLQSLGYRFVPLRGQQGLRGAAANLRHWHCYNFVSSSLRLAVDLHVRFAPRHFPVAADLSTFAGRLQPGSAGDQTLMRFDDCDALVLLAMHAAKDLPWRRLTWYSDMAMLVQRLSAAERALALQRATQIGCRLPLLLALLLVQQLYGLPADAAWPGSTAERTRLQPLAAMTLQHLFAPTPAEPHPLRVHFVVHPLLRERWRDRWAGRAAGLRALLQLLNPPAPAQPLPLPAQLLRYPAYWAGAATRQARRAVVGRRG